MLYGMILKVLLTLEVIVVALLLLMLPIQSTWALALPIPILPSYPRLLGRCFSACSTAVARQANTKILLCYGSKFAAHVSDALWKTSGIQAQVCTALYNMLHAITKLTTMHEAGHVDLPFNELADSCAKLHSRNAWQQVRIFDAIPVRWFCDKPREAQWAFLALLSDEDAAQFPIEIVDSQLYLSCKQCPIASWGVADEVVAKKIDKFQEKYSGRSQQWRSGHPAPLYHVC